MAGTGPGVGCPRCGGGLTAHLEVGIELRLIRAPAEDLSMTRYSLGAVHTHVPEIRDRALRQFGDGRLLYLDEDGIVVMCRNASCTFVGTLTKDGVEDEDNRRRGRREA